MKEIVNFEKDWNTLKGYVKEASEMPAGDTGSGMKKAYLMVLKLMDMIEEGEDEGVVCRYGVFKKEQNILSIVI